MAKMTYNGGTIESIRKQLSGRGVKVEGTVNHMLHAGAKVVREEMKAAMLEYRLKDTGAMMKSVKSSKITRNRDGGKSISISPQGVDKKGVPNAAKALVYERGSSKHPARPWKTLADERARDKAIARMTEVFNEAMGSNSSETGGGEE